MSLILDALNRSRQDEDSVPNLATHHPVEKITAGRRHALPWVVMSLTLAIALVVIAWLVLERFFAAPAPDAELGAPVAELSRNIGDAAESVTTELKTRAAASAKARSPAVDSGKPQSKPQPQTQPANVSELHTPPAAAAEAEVLRQTPVVEDPAVAQLYQNRDAVNEAAIQKPKSPAKTQVARPSIEPIALDNTVITIDEQPVDIEKVLQQARDDVKNEHLDEHAVPFLSTMSQQTKDGIPTVYYQGHDYSSNASISSVTLNGKPLKVGGSPVSGMKIEEILPDSVVLNYQGTAFRLRALNSWVNL